MLRRFGVLCFLAGLWFLPPAFSQQISDPQLDAFIQLHSQTLSPSACSGDYDLAQEQYFFCAKELRNQGNAPFVLWQASTSPAPAVVVLLHGLSDSPYYLHSVAQAIHAKGFNVVVGLIPGHGLTTNAETIFHDNNLRQVWRDYTDALITAVRPMGNKLLVGGFSTGGALAVDHILREPGSSDGLLLFSGALALADNAETLSKIPFAKVLGKWMDGDYQELGDNPYKYPSISSHAALILMDIIRNIRSALHESTGLKLPIFVAHSQADTVTPIEGVKGLLTFSLAEHTVVEAAESMAVCHAAIPLSKEQVTHIGIKDPNPLVPCDSPEYNPIHAQMIAMMQFYLLNIVNEE